MLATELNASRKGRLSLSISQELLDRLEPYKQQINLSAHTEALLAQLLETLENRAWPARQVFSDLAMALIPLNLWITKDARERNVAAWPVWVGTLALGSVAPLTYLLWRSLRVPVTPVTRTVPVSS